MYPRRKRKRLLKKRTQANAANITIRTRRTTTSSPEMKTEMSTPSSLLGINTIDPMLFVDQK
ncbi:Vid27 family protein [Histoplasma capsulatum]|uniref:Vid27 family protein n=1 Tax=Ajellomyces capsulatus TaxID=5037 RepID=A0A8A1MBQ6_AJECA|nr:Vid27 family protein [Histoplasma capsulatum]